MAIVKTIMDTTVDNFGRVLIPKAVRDRLGLKAGDHLAIDVHEHEMRLVQQANEGALVVKQGVTVHRGVAAGDLDAAVRDIRAARDRRLAGMD